MSWKKTLFFFIWQSIFYANSWKHFLQIWSFRKKWCESFRPGRNSIADELPWLNFLALDFLKMNLHPEFKVFEYGGGGSTLFFCKYTSEVITIEDSEEWFEILKRIITSKGYQNWKGYFVKAEISEGKRLRSPGNPADFLSGSRGLGNLSFEKYAQTINQFPKKYFDVILIDGRARPSCIEQSLPYVKPNGILIIDNTERPYYLAKFKEILPKMFKVEIDSFAPVAYSADFTKTTILRRLGANV